MAELVYSVAEAAKALGVSKNAMYDLIHRADFPALKVGRKWKVSKELLAEWVRKEASKDPLGAAGEINAPVHKEIRSQL